MKTTGTVAAILGLVSSATAHYTFDKLLVNDQQVGGDNTYIRKHNNGYMPIKFNNPPEGSITPLDADFSCNKGATGAPEVITVKAGDKIGLRQAFGANGIQHPGPSQVYIAPVSDAKTDGGSDWYKIHQSLVCREGSPETFKTNAWCSWDENNVWGVIPATIPNGQYLLRAEHIGLHGAHDGQAEFYTSCAQIEVTGNSATAIPGQSTKFPGGYQASDPAVNFSVWGRSTSYDTAPGPDVIPGGTIRGSASGAGGDNLQTVPGAGGSSSETVDTTDPAPSPSAPAPSPSAPAPSPSTPAPSPTGAPAPTPTVQPGNGEGSGNGKGKGKGKGKCPRSFPRRAAALLAAEIDAETAQQ
ncbi:glycosyl hydrolase family 61-domain-containing protein [Chaetomium fimeti]|uniref:lytic cellulose monooxygenase (C4-dehydrogenating) n=1 Tax=Chaetomium fimeti TaxID=1854472 RepID=A0AAE0HKB4_9PEZI|nr:glycosyl hydrolase family 61-domain-containing protein [Chaetomium fimeti]